jgi:hypothetical protein
MIMAMSASDLRFTAAVLRQGGRSTSLSVAATSGCGAQCLIAHTHIVAGHEKSALNRPEFRRHLQNFDALFQ